MKDVLAVVWAVFVVVAGVAIFALKLETDRTKERLARESLERRAEPKLLKPREVPTFVPAYPVFAPLPAHSPWRVSRERATAPMPRAKPELAPAPRAK